MKILQTQVYRGANLWAPVPVIRLSLEISRSEVRSTNLVPDFYEKLATTLPLMEEHQFSPSMRGSWGERVREGITLGHVAQHTVLELQNIAGQKLDCDKTCLAFDPGDETITTCHAVFQYEQQDVGIAAGHLVVRLLDFFLHPERESDFDFVSELKEFKRLAASLSYGPSTRALVAEARRRDIPVLRLDDSQERVQLGRGTRALRSLLQFGYGKHQRRIWAPYISTERHLAADIALNKDLTNRLVRDAGLPVPQSIRARDEESAVAAARDIGYPVVLKPLDGNHGRGVGVNLQDDAAVRAHYPLAGGETHTGTVLVEKFIPGNTYRILVVGGRAVAVTEEVPAHVVGDGSHTLRQLVKLTNADSRRGHGSENLLVRIRLDETAIGIAQKQGYGADDVPPAGKHVQLVRTAHISLGGISIDRTDEVHPHNMSVAEQAAQVVGLQVAGIDLIAPDIAQSVRENGGAICEVNAGPGLGLHIQPVEGKPRDVARPVIELLFPPGATSRVPIVAVTGTAGRTSTSQLIAHILGSTGRTVGLATSDGTYLGGTHLLPGHMNGSDSARTILRNPAIDTAVLEIGYDGILASGLGYDRDEVVVITQISDRHSNFDGLDNLQLLGRLNAVVANSVNAEGSIVLNADDERCTEIGTQARQRVMYFSMCAGNPAVEKHVLAGGRAVVRQRDAGGEGLYLLDGGRATLVFTRDIPTRSDGRDRYSTATALAATAACVALDLDSTSIGFGLRTFGTG